MAIIPTKARKTRSYIALYIIIAFFLGATGNLLIYLYPVELPEQTRNMILGGDEKKLSELTLNLRVKDNPNFRPLKLYGKYPIEIVTGGRADPFSP